MATPASESSSLRFAAWLPRWGCAVALAALVLSAPGCVRRRLLIRSNPPGATVYVDNQPIGVTPCATSFVYYGTREIRLVKPGYETLTINQPIPAPWFELPGIDFISENVLPNEIQDYRTVSYTMSPQAVVPSDTLVSRANQLRQAAQTGGPIPIDAGPLVSPTLGAGPLGPPSIVTPGGQSVLAPQGIPAPTLAPPEQVSPGVPVPTTPGAGVLPPGGQVLEPLPPAR